VLRYFSSRRQPLDATYLNAALEGALTYDRIAGYFSSSLLEIAGEAIASVEGKVRIICNSDLHPNDVLTARAADLAIRNEWTSKADAILSLAGKDRFGKLYDLLIHKKIEVRVLPSDFFGLVHGKAGVITKADGQKICFLGSVNETLSAWKLNYELMWEADDQASIQWVQEEFDALWNDPRIVKLSDAIVEDIGRIAGRKVVQFKDWRKNQEPAAVLVESPVYRKEYGLWAHQKYFISKAFEAHKIGIGARYVLADMVGLGKTIQLATSAMLMALHGSKPVLIVVPKTLIWQWQTEMKVLLDMPSAVWDGRRWIDENEIAYPPIGPEGIKKCPRRVGIISQGLLLRKGKIVEILLDNEYECVIVDECHRARRKNLRPNGENDRPEPNNLLNFLFKIGKRTKSFLLGTATPVQLYPIEAYDLLDALSQGNDHVLGDVFSIWRRDKAKTIAIVKKEEPAPTSPSEIWEYMRNPLPQAKEQERLFGAIRLDLELKHKSSKAVANDFDNLRPAVKRRIEDGRAEFFEQHNPFIRHIIRRTRDFLENEIDPATGETYLKKVEVKLFGEKAEESILLPGYLQDAYKTAEEFSRVLAKRVKSAGFMKMLLLKRMGSSIEAGKATAKTLLGNNYDEAELDEFADETDEFDSADSSETSEEKASSDFKTLTLEEITLLNKLIYQLEKHTDKDPKYFKILELLQEEGWADLGCIIFSQFYDTVWSMANQISKSIPDQPIGIYAGGSKSGILLNAQYEIRPKEEIKRMVQSGDLKILFGTDSASEGLNLQRLSTLINIDLPWNPTRLEQRKGRIQRIGQVRDTVFVYNMRYKDSVEDRIHELLSERLEQIHGVFGQIPDVLEDAWVSVALDKIEDAKARINAIPKKHPFEIKYNRIESIDWESCKSVLDKSEIKNLLAECW
jgi:superfamily II DNA or RNA helicase